MKKNQELVDIITILDDYDCVVKTIHMGYKYIEYFTENGKLYGAEFEEIEDGIFPK